MLLSHNRCKLGTTFEFSSTSDSKDRLVATTQKPLVEADQFAFPEVVDVKPGIGVFLDWGLDKHLLLPHREQGDWDFRVGDGAVVAVYVDDVSQRMVASTRLHRHQPTEKNQILEPNTPVDLLIYGNSPLGYKAFVNRRYRGLIYHQENSDVLEPGDQFVGYIKKVHSNGKIDSRRDPSGYGRADQIAEKIFTQLQAAGGQMASTIRAARPRFVHNSMSAKKPLNKPSVAYIKCAVLSLPKAGFR